MPSPLRLLSLEAGGERISAALFEDGRCLASAFEEAKQRQTERLAPLVQGLLEQGGWEAESLAAIAVGRGPGSFTGLRSSMALAQGLALGSPARLIGVDTLSLWAEAGGAGAAAVALDGRRGQAYFARFQKKGPEWLALEEPALLDQAEAWRRLGSFPLLTDLESAALPAGVSLLKRPQAAELAQAAGRLGWQSWSGHSGAPLQWEPLYLRRAEVEILWEKLHPKAP
jgi:tRNA threonylcarbamoyl adenosine modification protein YeaZ